MSKWPNYTPYAPYPNSIQNGPTKQEWEDFKDMIQKALELDKKTGQPDCIDPKKEEWMKKMSQIYDETFK